MIVGREGGGEERRERGDGAVHQPDEAGLHDLEEELVVLILLRLFRRRGGVFGRGGAQRMGSAACGIVTRSGWMLIRPTRCNAVAGTRYGLPSRRPIVWRCGLPAG